MTQQNLRSAIVVYQLIPSSFNSPSGSHFQNLGTGATQNPNSQNYLSLLITPEGTTSSNLETNPIQKVTSNIPLAMVTENKTLAVIFLFEFEETTPVLLFSGATLEEKPITAMYTDAKVDGHSIKLILDSGSEHRLCQTKTTGRKPITIVNHAIENAMATQRNRASGTMNHVSLVVNNCLMKECEMTFLVEEKYGYSHNKEEIWQMANAKVENATPNEILKIKNNPPELVDIICIPNSDAFMDKKTGPENFHKYYQNLALIREEQEQCLEQLNT
ncbi:hypothetical protein G9A89_012537 [Geosiphon pyriformis]|nr:hypothetical protein G9A89_012537 [Geosiphon pyriformis]